MMTILKRDNMKILILLSLFILVSCGKKVSDEPFSPADIRQMWQSTDGFTGEIDLRDMNNIVIYDVELNGVVSDCYYSSSTLEPKLQYGKIDLTVTGGDPVVCEKYKGSNVYFAFTDNDEKETTLNFGKTGMYYAYKL